MEEWIEQQSWVQVGQFTLNRLHLVQKMISYFYLLRSGIIPDEACICMQYCSFLLFMYLLTLFNYPWRYRLKLISSLPNIDLYMLNIHHYEYYSILYNLSWYRTISLLYLFTIVWKVLHIIITLISEMVFAFVHNLW